MLQGYVDIANQNMIAGWAWDSDYPARHLIITITIGEKISKQIKADEYREELKNAGVGDGTYGFSLIIMPWNRADRLSVAISGTGMLLPYSNAALLGFDSLLPVEGRPVPPESLRQRVAGTGDADWFDRSGARTTDEWCRALQCVGRNIREFSTVVDFGCGSGRALRYLGCRLAFVQTLIGVDVDHEAVAWLNTAYPQVRALPIAETPPMPLPDKSVDLVLSHSVFTHLPEHVGRAWLLELNRILKKGGILITSFHGDRVIREYSMNLRDKDETSTFVSTMEKVGFHYVSGKTVAEQSLPEYYGSAFHTIQYIRKYWTDLFYILAWLPTFALEYQDLLVLQKI